MLDLSSRKVYGALAEQCVGGDAKADKVETAVAGHLAGLDSNGNLTDSGVSPTEDVTVEGNPVTFDSPFEQDAKSVVVKVKPIQDLHGQSAPYVGGAGKNKLPLVLADIKAINTSGTWTGNTYTKDGMSYTILVDDGDNVVGIRVNGETSVNTSLNLPLFSLPTGTYIVSVGALRSRLNKNGSQIADISANQSYTLTVDSNSDEFILYLYPGATTISNVTVYPMIRLSTESDATFAPYSNICPISGIDEVEIGVSGKNQFDGDWQYGLIDTTTGEVTPHMYVKYHDYIRVKPSTWYTMCAYNMHDLVNPFDIFGYDKNKHYVGLIPINIINNTTALFAEKFQIPSNVAFIRMHIADSTLGTSDKQQLEVGETYTEYEPYVSHTTTIPLPSTLYDADVDVTNGSADSRFGMVTDDSISNISTGTSSGGMYWSEILVSANAKIGGNAISSHLPYVSDGNIAWIMQEPCFTVNANGGIRIYTDESTVEGLKAKLANLQICYELATPTTISFTPADIELLEGTNVVSTNGEKVAVKYGRSLWQDIDELKTDTEGKLDKSDVADIEGDTASKAYSVNDFMLRADGLYKVTQPIAQNASITASNTTKTTVGEVLTALLNA